MINFLYRIKHLLYGNYCYKCNSCYYMDKSHASSYDGSELCEHCNPVIIYGDYHQIVDCKTYRSKLWEVGDGLRI